VRQRPPHESGRLRRVREHRDRLGVGERFFQDLQALADQLAPLGRHAGDHPTRSPEARRVPDRDRVTYEIENDGNCVGSLANRVDARFVRSHDHVDVEPNELRGEYRVSRVRLSTSPFNDDASAVFPTEVLQRLLEPEAEIVLLPNLVASSRPSDAYA
jgi:hypothetical protein